MTRLEQTAEESITESSLLNHLKQSDPNLTDIERELKDRPDLAFIFNGRRVACECVQIPPHRVLKYVHTRFKKIKGNGAVQIVWPQEPHIWAKDAIEAKTKKTGAYRKNVNADEVWLLLHSPVNERDTTLRYENQIIVELIKYAAAHTKHKFSNIYFWDPKNGIQKIYPSNRILASLDINFEGGYPTDGFLIGTLPFTTAAEGEAPYEIYYGIIEPEVIIVPPMDPEFKRHKPRFKLRRYRVSAVVSATSADFKYEPIEQE
ncbi:hypothetical protein SAMN02745866_04092 [Alteromonadaceae bacterium Bs31]|nr:hypothetical protein SAMN02745866_04092 [Alteromonadaceae bacterium Bs31]